MDYKFGSVKVLNDMLQDQLVCGVGESRMRRRLTSEKILTLILISAFKIAKAMKMAECSLHRINTTS